MRRRGRAVARGYNEQRPKTNSLPRWREAVLSEWSHLHGTEVDGGENYFFALAFFRHSSFFALSVILSHFFASPAANAGPAMNDARMTIGSTFFSMIEVLPDPVRPRYPAGTPIIRTRNCILVNPERTSPGSHRARYLESIIGQGF